MPRKGLILTDVNTMADGEFRNNFLTRAVTWNPGGVLNGARHARGGRQLRLHRHAEAARRRRSVGAAEARRRGNTADERSAQRRAPVPISVRGGRGRPQRHRRHASRQTEARRRRARAAGRRSQAFVARTFAYVAAGKAGLAIIDIERAEKPKLYATFNADGKIADARDVVVATTNASLFAYVADGKAGLKVIQLTSPASQPRFYGFSPDPKPELIAWYATKSRRCRCHGRSNAIAPWTKRAGRWRCSAGAARVRSISRRCIRCISIEKGDPWFVDDDAVPVPPETQRDLRTTAR